jgi:2-aminoadipate transaminase
MKNLKGKLAKWLQNAKRSEIRELLKLLGDPSIISLGGGFPDPNFFPVKEIQEITNEILANKPELALQYCTTEGMEELRNQLVSMCQRQGMQISKENVIVTSGGQAGLDLLGKMFIDVGDTIICELPSYLGAIQAFKMFGANLIGIKMDKDGMIVSELRSKLEDLRTENRLPKFIYLVPDFQNPSGVTMSLERREEIISLSREFGEISIVEDSPYREISFGIEMPPTMFSLAPDIVINLGTLSKIVLPGFRIGWMIAGEDIIKAAVMVKQSTDLCTSPFTQLITAKFIEKYLPFHLSKLREVYQEKRDCIMDEMILQMPKGVSWNNPDGGLFTFVYLPDGMDAAEVLKKAIKNGVAFVPGSAFHCDGSGKNTMRINFSFSSQKNLGLAIERLAKTINEF